MSSVSALLSSAKSSDNHSENYSMLLDSGINEESSNEQKEQGFDCSLFDSSSYDNRRYDIFCAKPCLTLTMLSQKALIINRISPSLNNIKIDSLEQDPLNQMRIILNQVKKLCKNDSQSPSSPDQNTNLPFKGGWLGYLSYEYGKSLELEEKKQKTEMEPDIAIPLCRFGLYRWALINDHKKQTTTLYNFGLANSEWEAIKLLFKEPKKSDPIEVTEFKLKSVFKSNIDYKSYQEAFNKIQENILHGNCYQINYAHQFSAPFEGCSFQAYQQLSKINYSPFSAFLNFGDFQILSLSPERFIKVKHNKVLTQPIKGTAPRNVDVNIDKQNAKNLLSSEKDRAENLMIVDLLRNDLSKTADVGSVKVPELFGLYSFEAVHHLISTITSTIAPKYDVFDLLQSCLPGGSITGAPKIAAMKIIEQLETFKRGIYCGVIGYIDFDGNMDTNICIRTLLAKNGQLICSAGGGIVYDSTVESEYQETFHKVSKIIPVLEELFFSNTTPDCGNLTKPT